jgi:hypothetical protein
MNKQIRELEDNLVAVINASQVPYECKRVVLENLMIKCELKAFEEMATETITEKGELDNGTELD